ncbi:helix-turn-helix domain-containing protein [Embleya sp. NPDC008237]|uniref:helix-turn-helix domain-containing protein n=1 Tax=Embleya sp. NPDC008237 TaxID=3363978 RepID=UPI0036E5B3C9
MALTPTYARRRLGAELRRLRVRAALTGESVAETCGWSHTKVVRIETAKVSLSRHDLSRLCGLYEATEDETARLEGWREDTRGSRWWLEYESILSARLQEYISLEAQASSIHAAGSSVMPGLLQSRGYAQALFDTAPLVPDPDEADVLLEVRMRRQKLLAGDVTVSVTMAAALLYVYTGGREVLRGQLEHLLKIGKLPNVELHVVPFESASRPIEGGITLFDFASAHEPSVAVSEHQGGLVIRDGDIEVRRFRRILDHLKMHALSAEATESLIRRRLEEL